MRCALFHALSSRDVLKRSHVRVNPPPHTTQAGGERPGASRPSCTGVTCAVMYARGARAPVRRNKHGKARTAARSAERLSFVRSSREVLRPFSAPRGSAKLVPPAHTRAPLQQRRQVGAHLGRVQQRAPVVATAARAVVHAISEAGHSIVQLGITRGQALGHGRGLTPGHAPAQQTLASRLQALAVDAARGRRQFIRSHRAGTCQS
jgi:hypothetical protein